MICHMYRWLNYHLIIGDFRLTRTNTDNTNINTTYLRKTLTCSYMRLPGFFLQWKSHLLVFITHPKTLFYQGMVLLVSMDGFRWDYVNKVDTPNFDRMAREDPEPNISIHSLLKLLPCHYTIVTGKNLTDLYNICMSSHTLNTFLSWKINVCLYKHILVIHQVWPVINPCIPNWQYLIHSHCIHEKLAFRFIENELLDSKTIHLLY